MITQSLGINNILLFFIFMYVSVSPIYFCGFKVNKIHIYICMFLVNNKQKFELNLIHFLELNYLISLF